MNSWSKWSGERFYATVNDKDISPQSESRFIYYINPEGLAFCAMSEVDNDTDEPVFIPDDSIVIVGDNKHTSNKLKALNPNHTYNVGKPAPKFPLGCNPRD